MPSGSRCPTNLRLLADGAVAVLLAPLCAACREPLEHPTRGAVCGACWDAIDPLAVPAVEAIAPHISAAVALGLHDGRLRDVIQALKYDARPTIARHLGRRMARTGAGVLTGADGVVPVPLHRSRERRRGFNQARELARHLGLPLRDVLVRTRRTETQADLPAGKRHGNVRGAFALRPDGQIAGLTVVLIDDVSTTGATLSACAAVLRAAGAAEVRALTAARAPLR
jgi:ComF family protein